MFNILPPTSEFPKWQLDSQAWRNWSALPWVVQCFVRKHRTSGSHVIGPATPDLGLLDAQGLHNGAILIGSLHLHLLPGDILGDASSIYFLVIQWYPSPKKNWINTWFFPHYFQDNQLEGKQYFFFIPSLPHGFKHICSSYLLASTSPFRLAPGSFDIVSEVFLATYYMWQYASLILLSPPVFVVWSSLPKKLLRKNSQEQCFLSWLLACP